MLLCLVIFVRSFRGVIVPILATVGGIVCVLGYSSLLGVKSNTTMLALPVLLGMALSVGYSIHYINEFRLHFRNTGKRKESVIKAVEETGWPILFTVITTMASMISFMTVGIGELKWVGGICSAIVFATYLYVIILIPIFMSYTPSVFFRHSPFCNRHSLLSNGDNKKNIVEKHAAKYTKADMFFERFGEAVANRKWLIAGVSAAIIALCLPWCFRLTVNMDYVEMMGNKVPYVERLLSVLSGKLGSLYSYDVMISYDDSDAFKSAEKMKNLEALEEKLGKLKLTKISGGKPRVTSACQMLKEINRMFNGDDIAFYSLSDDDAVTAQYLVLYSENFEDWFDTASDDFGTTHIHVELAGYDANVIVSDIEGAKSSAKELFPDAKISIVGEVVEYAEMNHKLVSAELKSFSLSFVIIAILLILAFSSLGTGLIGMIPNLAPVIVVGGVMGYAGYSLDMLTMTIMPMILGIAVDDTIHLINHIKLQLEKNGDYKEAVVISFREIGKTMGMTTFILCAMFFMYTFSPMGCLFRIGILAMIGLSSALLADYTLTPALIALTKPFGKKIK